MDEIKYYTQYRLHSDTVKDGFLPMRLFYFSPEGATKEQKKIEVARMLSADPLSVLYPEGIKWYSGSDRVCVISYAHDIDRKK